MDNLKFLLIELGSIVAVFAVVETLLKEEDRKALGKYIFGTRAAAFSDFENSVIRGLLGIFMVDGNLSWRRIYALSLTISAATILITQSVTTNPLPNDRYWLNVYSILPTSLIALPFDYWSLRVTKYFFWDHSPQAPRSFLSFLADLALSLLPLFLLFFWIVVGVLIYRAWYGGDATHQSWPFWMERLVFAAVLSIAANFLSSIALSIVQAITLILGSVLRGLVMLTRLTGWLSERSELQNHPLSAIGLFLGLISVLF